MQSTATDFIVDDALADYSPPPHAGDIAQARRFSRLLQDEIAQLEELHAVMERRRFRAGGPCSPRHSELRVGVRASLREAHRLLEALRRRFPDV
jgi:hypothetical protein